MRGIEDLTRSEFVGTGFSLLEQNLFSASSTGVTFSIPSEDSSGGTTTEHSESLLFEKVDGSYKLVGLFSAG